MRKFAIVCILLILVTIAEATPRSSRWLGEGEMKAAYGLQDGGSLIVALTGGDIVVIESPSYDNHRETWLNIDNKPAPPVISTEICGGYLHIFYHWPGDDIYHYAYPLPEAHEFYLPVVCQ